MDEMLVLADNHQNCPLFEHFFLERLPEDIRLQLANDDFMDARKIALKTDLLWQAKSTSQPMSISKVMQPLDTVSTPKYTCCFYHHEFGEKAKKCRPPCDFKVTVNNFAAKQDNLLFICDKKTLSS